MTTSTATCGTDELAGACPERGWKGRLAAQFGRPTGWFGRLAGWTMALKNRRRGSWVVSLLDVWPEDRVFEIGFGPGADLARVAELASRGVVAGVDHSREMVRMARARTPAAELREASADRLPFDDGAFDKVFSINSVQFWPDRAAAFREIRRVLRPGGLAAIALEPRGAATQESALEDGRRLAAEIEQAGFAHVSLETAELGPVPTVCVLGRKAG